MKKLQEILGHSSYLMTANVYSHLYPEAHKEAARKMSGIFPTGAAVGS